MYVCMYVLGQVLQRGVGKHRVMQL